MCVKGQSVIKIPANPVSSEKGAIAAGWSGRTPCRKNNRWKINPQRQDGEQPEGSRGKVRRSLGCKKHKSDRGLRPLKILVAFPYI